MDEERREIELRTEYDGIVIEATVSYPVNYGRYALGMLLGLGEPEHLTSIARAMIEDEDASVLELYRGLEVNYLERLLEASDVEED